MKCGKVRELFSSHMEDAMDGRQSAEFEEHLRTCAECHAACERVNATIMMLDEIPEVEPPADFHATVMARVQEARRAAPQRVKWWSIDWQHVFTIRVPARAAALGLAVVLLAAVVMQLTPMSTVSGRLIPGGTGDQQISSTDPDAPRSWEPWIAKSKTDAGLKLTIKMESANTYALTLGTVSDRAIAFAVNAGDENYNGVVKANQDTTVTVPAPKAGVTVAKVSWNYGDADREESVFLPARMSREPVSKSLALSGATAREVLGKLSQEYGVAIIASGYLDRKIAGGQFEDKTADEALYYFLDGSGMNRRTLSSSVFAVEPSR